MTVNRLLNPYYDGEQRSLIKELMEEITQIHGVEIHYLPRKSLNQDDLLGEDPNAFYDKAIVIEALPINVDNWEGEGDIISNFGIDIKDRITFQILKHRWEQEKSNNLVTSSGGSILTSFNANNVSDHTIRPVSSKIFDTSRDITPYVLRNANGTPILDSDGDYIITPNVRSDFMIDAIEYDLPDRPMEGDLIWFDIPKKLFVITFVEHEKMFYPLGERMTYQLTCELFDYSSEVINTGIPEIDIIEDNNTTDVIPYVIKSADGRPITDRNGNYIFSSASKSEFFVDNVKYANNEAIQTEADDDMIFNEHNPLTIEQRNY